MFLIHFIFFLLSELQKPYFYYLASLYIILPLIGSFGNSSQLIFVFFSENYSEDVSSFILSC